jgi:hypothetical protein
VTDESHVSSECVCDAQGIRPTKYREMAADQQREREAHEWSEALIGDASKQT